MQRSFLICRSQCMWMVALAIIALERISKDRIASNEKSKRNLPRSFLQACRIRRPNQFSAGWRRYEETVSIAQKFFRSVIKKQPEGETPATSPPCAGLRRQPGRRASCLRFEARLDPGSKAKRMGELSFRCEFHSATVAFGWQIPGQAMEDGKLIPPLLRIPSARLPLRPARLQRPRSRQ